MCRTCFLHGIAIDGVHMNVFRAAVTTEMMLGSVRFSSRFLKSFRILSGFCSGHHRHINCDIGQPTSYSHPHLMKEGEGEHYKKVLL